jgi:DNA-directed RNA polymerase subunit N (RpoN/RPB10)
MSNDARELEIRDFEDDAEVLFVQHLDLLVQLEAQLRAAHHTMRRIERLRGGSRRVGPELANGEREAVLMGLAKEVDELDSHIGIEHDCCREMHTTIVEMQQRVKTLKRLATRLHQTPGRSAQDEADHTS